MKIQDPTLRVAPNTPALPLIGTEIRVSGLTDRTCKLIFAMFWFSINLSCSDRCCFQKGLGYEMREVIDVTVTNCTEVKYY